LLNQLLVSHNYTYQKRAQSPNPNPTHSARRMVFLSYVATPTVLCLLHAKANWGESKKYDVFNFRFLKATCLRDPDLLQSPITGGISRGDNSCGADRSGRICAQGSQKKKNNVKKMPRSQLRQGNKHQKTAWKDRKQISVTRSCPAVLER